MRILEVLMSNNVSSPVSAVVVAVPTSSLIPKSYVYSVMAVIEVLRSFRATPKQNAASRCPSVVLNTSRDAPRASQPTVPSVIKDKNNFFYKN